MAGPRGDAGERVANEEVRHLYLKLTIRLPHLFVEMHCGHGAIALA